MKRICAFVVVCFSVFATVPKCDALTFDQSLAPIPGFTPGVSHDASQFNIFAAVTSFVSPIFYQAVGPFSGQAGGGTNFQLWSLGGATFADGQHGVGVDTLGVLGSNGGFTGLLDNSVIGATTTFFADENEEYTFAMQTPFSMISSIATDNPSDEIGLFFVQVTQDITVTLSNLSLNNPAPFTFSFLTGDWLIFGNDRPSSCVTGVCGDYDFNDFVGVIRQSAAVPEPASVLLGGLGAATAMLRRRKKAAQV